jgi:hypothetical protein
LRVELVDDGAAGDVLRHDLRLRRGAAVSDIGAEQQDRLDWRVRPAQGHAEFGNELVRRDRHQIDRGDGHRHYHHDDERQDAQRYHFALQSRRRLTRGRRERQPRDRS